MATVDRPPVARFTVALSAEQDEVLDGYRRQLRTTRSAIIETALIEYFGKRGMVFPDWPRRLTA